MTRRKGSVGRARPTDVAHAGKPFRRELTIKDGVLTVQESADTRADFEQAFGSANPDFHNYALKQIIGLLPKNERQSAGLTDVNAAIAFLAALKPTNEVEALLAVQMFMAHHHSMLAAYRLAGSNLLEQANANGNLATKFSRTFAMQVDTLSRLRRGGEQIVKHVHVNEGGQAVIAGTVNSGGGKCLNRLLTPCAPSVALGRGLVEFAVDLRCGTVGVICTAAKARGRPKGHATPGSTGLGLPTTLRCGGLRRCSGVKSRMPHRKRNVRFRPKADIRRAEVSTVAQCKC